jgi:hypothetical protein
MKHVAFKPKVEQRSYGRILFERYLHIGRRTKKRTGCDVFTNFLEESQIQEKPPIGIETSMVYIAIPAGLAVWAILIYCVKFLLF